MPRTKQLVGLDIGTRTVRAAWVCVRDRRPVVVRTEQLALPPDAQDPAGIIRAWVAKCGLSRQFCAIALPGGNTIFQPGKIAHKDPRTPRQVAAMELAAFNDMAGDTMTFDIADYAVAADPDNRYYLMAMARPSAIARALQVAAQVGVRPADLVPAPVALFNRLEGFAGEHVAPTLYIDIGHNQTELVAGLPEGALFARSVPIGGKTFTDVLAQAAGLTPHQAEVRKHADGLTGETAALLKPAADRWLSQVSSCLSVYRSAFPAAALAPARIVLAGGGAALAGLREAVAERFKLPVAAAGELPGFAGDDAGRAAAGGFSLAIGLAVSALELGPARLSLLPAHLRDEVVFRDKKPYWIAAAVCGALALVVFTVSGLRAMKREDRILQEERERLRAREQIDKQITAIRARGDALRERARRVQDLLGNAPLAREALTFVANSMGPDDWVTLFCDESSYTPQAGEAGAKPAAAAKPAPASPRPGAIVIAPPKAKKEKPAAAKKAAAAPALPPRAATQTFIIEGYTADPSWDSVKKIIDRLRSSPLAAAVDLRADDRVLPPAGFSDAAGPATLPVFRRFVVSLEVKRP